MTNVNIAYQFWQLLFLVEDYTTVPKFLTPVDRPLPIINTTRKSRKWLLFSAYYWLQTKTKHTPTHDLSKAKHQHFIFPIKRTEIRHRALAVKTKTPEDRTEKQRGNTLRDLEL